jgi:hypothetical protein
MYHVGNYVNIAILVQAEIIPGGVEILVICRAVENIHMVHCASTSISL